MSLASKVVVGMTVVSLGVSGLSALTPRTAQERAEQRRQELVEQGSDAQEQGQQRRREQAADGMEAERQDRLRPAEHRPPPVRVRLR